MQAYAKQTRSRKNVNAKAQGLSLNTMAIAALVLIVVVVVIAIFTDVINDIAPWLKDCSSRTGTCSLPQTCEDEEGSTIPGRCNVEGEVCCNINPNRGSNTDTT